MGCVVYFLHCGVIGETETRLLVFIFVSEGRNGNVGWTFEKKMSKVQLIVLSRVCDRRQLACFLRNEISELVGYRNSLVGQLTHG